MYPVLRPANLYLLLTYLVLSALPFLGALAGTAVERPWQVLGVEIVAWIMVWAVFKRPARFHWLLIPAFAAAPVELYLYIYYGQGISTHHLGIIAETSPQEAVEFLGSAAWLVLVAVVAVVAWWISSYRAALGTRDLDWEDSSRLAALGALLLGAGVWAYGKEFGIEKAAKAAAPAPPAAAHVQKVGGKRPAPASAPAPAMTEEEKAAEPARMTGLDLPKLPEYARLPLELNAFARSWPFGVTSRSYDFYKERRYLALLGERNSSFTFSARQAKPDNEPEIVVMVIGESARADRWSLNGYERNTNPLLGKEANLVNLPDVITGISATRLSVPVMISRKSTMQSLQAGFVEKSFLTAFKEAGFKTWWLSNQVSFGKFDTPVSVFAKEADVLQFYNMGGFTDNSNFDQVLLDPLKAAIADPSPKKLVVLHTLGSHWNYAQRYPKEFDRWQPSLFGVKNPDITSTSIKPQLGNSYDSTILYTDWFLANVIGVLKQTQNRSAMVYVSDHGETLYDKTCRRAFHGHNFQYEFHIPAFAWYSDRYRADRPEKVAQLRRHRGARLSTENMFHTLLDLGGISYPGERLERSFASPQFKPHTRYVDSYGWSNYDNATMKGDCREVIDKGTPLKRAQPRAD